MGSASPGGFSSPAVVFPLLHGIRWRRCKPYQLIPMKPFRGRLRLAYQPPGRRNSNIRWVGRQVSQAVLLQHRCRAHSTRPI